MENLPFSIQLNSYHIKHLPPSWLEVIYDHKWFKIFIPQSLNGLEATLEEGLQIMYDTATIHGSLGWSVNLGSGASYFAGFMEEATAKAIFSASDAGIAGSGQVGRAVLQGDTYQISGNWSKCSGAAHATAFTVNAAVDNGAVHSFVLLPSQVQVEDNWHHFALKGSSSFSIKTAAAQIPLAYRFDIGKQQSFFDYPIYRIPFESFARCCMFASLLGIVQCFERHLVTIPNLPLQRINTYLEDLSKTRINSLEILKTVAASYWQSAKNGLTDAILQDEVLPSHIRQSSATIYQLTQQIFYEVGLYLTDERQLAHYAYRDVVLGAQHFLLK